LFPSSALTFSERKCWYGLILRRSAETKREKVGIKCKRDRERKEERERQRKWVKL
jgi:hypothetical protein